MPDELVRLPRRFVLAIVGLCLLPVLLNSLGVTFELTQPADLERIGPVALDGVADPVELYALPQA